MRAPVVWIGWHVIFLLSLLGMAQTAPLVRAGQIEPKPDLELNIQLTSSGRFKTDANETSTPAPRMNHAGVQIEVCEYPIGAKVQILATYQTNALGKVTVQIPAQGYEVVNDQRIHLAVRVNELGFQGRFADTLQKQRNSVATEYSAQIPLIAGNTVLGNVQGPNGSPVPCKLEFRFGGPSVTVKPIFSRRGCRRGIPPRQGLQFLGAGSFAFHYTKDLSVDFLATASGYGTAVLLGVDLSIDFPREPLTMNIVGPGFLRGSLVDGEGHPMASQWVRCMPTSGQEAHARPDWICQNWSDRSPGILTANTRTDAQGRFEFKGLRSGAYRLSTSNHPLVLRAGAFRAHHEADGHEITLVATPATIRIKLIGLDGEPMQGHASYLGMFDIEGQVPVLSVSESVSTPWGSEPGRKIYHQFDPESGDNTARVTAGLSYWVRVWGGAFEELRVPVQVTETGYCAPIIIKAKRQPDHRTGTIQIGVTDGYGDEVEYSSAFGVRIECARTGTPLITKIGFDWDDYFLEPKAIELPVGSYKLIVSGARAPYIAGTVYHDIRLGRTERLIQVASGSAETYELRLKKAGKLKILLQGFPATNDVLVAKFDRMSGPQSTWGPGLDHHGANAYPWEPNSVAKLTLYQEGQLPIRVTHLVHGTNAMQGICDRWPLNEKLSSDFIPAGDYLLVTELAAGRRVEREVTVTAGKIQGVRVIIP